MAKRSWCSTACCGGRGGGSVAAGCSTALGRVGDPAGGRVLPHTSHTRAPSPFSYVQAGHIQTIGKDVARALLSFLSKSLLDPSLVHLARSLRCRWTFPIRDVDSYMRPMPCGSQVSQSVISRRVSGTVSIIGLDYILRRFTTGSPIDGTHWLPNISTRLEPLRARGATSSGGV